MLRLVKGKGEKVAKKADGEGGGEEMFEWVKGEVSYLLSYDTLDSGEQW